MARWPSPCGALPSYAIYPVRTGLADLNRRLRNSSQGNPMRRQMPGGMLTWHHIRATRRRAGVEHRNRDRWACPGQEQANARHRCSRRPWPGCSPPDRPPPPAGMPPIQRVGHRLVVPRDRPAPVMSRRCQRRLPAPADAAQLDVDDAALAGQQLQQPAGRTGASGPAVGAHVDAGELLVAGAVHGRADPRHVRVGEQSRAQGAQFGDRAGPGELLPVVPVAVCLPPPGHQPTVPNACTSKKGVRVPFFP